MAYSLGGWDLSGLAGGSDGPELQRHVRKIERGAKKFRKLEAGLKPSMSPKKFMDMVRQTEKISEQMGVVGSYASLAYSADTQSDEATSLLTRISKLGAEIANQTLFFDLWWKTQVDQKNAARLAKGAGELAGYLEYKRRVARYSLSEPEERIINTLDVTGVSALTKIYDKMTGAFEYKMRIKNKTRTMTREEVSIHVKSPSPKMRRAAYRTIFEKYAQNRGVIGEIYQNIALNWRDEYMEIRGHGSPISVRNIANDIDDKTVQSLLAVCQDKTAVFGRFFAQKARMLGLGKLQRYDVYAPATSDQKKYTYDRSVRMVLESLGRFSPLLEGLARRVFSENHVDSQVRRGKRDGAFCSTPAPGITPYVLLNFTGRTRDVFTLAHEIGHAVHGQAARERSVLVHDAPLPIAETASTFSELLLYDSIAQNATDDEKKTMLSEKIDDLYATIQRQAFFTLFESEAHRQIGEGATVGDISKAYMRNLKKQFGRYVDVSGDFAAEWSCIPHFYHAPFYCYAYSFGNLLALSLFQRYKKEGRDFVPTYISILAAGGSKKPERLLEEHGFDIRSARFWREGFEYVEEQVGALSRLN